MNEIQKDFGQRSIEFAKTKDGDVLGLGETFRTKMRLYVIGTTNLANKMSDDMRLIDPSTYDPSRKSRHFDTKQFWEISESNPHKGTRINFSMQEHPEKQRASWASYPGTTFGMRVGLDAERWNFYLQGINLESTQLRQKLKDELLLDDSQ